MTNGIKDLLGINIKDVKLIETFYDEEYPFYHYIYRAGGYFGNPVKGYYDGIYWKKLNEINSGDMNVISLQVLQKITECTYCLKICDKKLEMHLNRNRHIRSTII